VGRRGNRVTRTNRANLGRPERLDGDLMWPFCVREAMA